MTAALYYVGEELENLMRTDRQRTENRQTENSKPEATLIPVDRRGERANTQPPSSVCAGERGSLSGCPVLDLASSSLLYGL